jgi:hypothetical protein
MNKKLRLSLLLIQALVILTLVSSRLRADTGTCGGQIITLPFTDVMLSPFFCQIAEAYFSGLTNGTSATTYSPHDSVPREQMAAFITRTQDSALRRGSRRAALNQFWTPQTTFPTQITSTGAFVQLVACDGEDVWIANSNDNTVSRIHTSDGLFLANYINAPRANSPLVAMGSVFVVGATNPGSLYQIDPRTHSGTPVTVLTTALGHFSAGITFDGSRLWIANTGSVGGDGSVSIVTLTPFSVTTVTTGFTDPFSMVFDGANVWAVDTGAGTLLKLNPDGSIAQTVNLFGAFLDNAVFDGTNIWVPDRDSAGVFVVRASTGAILARLTGNGLVRPVTAAFDGQRVLVTNSSGDNICLWKATDLSPLGCFPTGLGTFPFGAASDGINFWVSLQSKGQLLRF